MTRTGLRFLLLLLAASLSSRAVAADAACVPRSWSVSKVDKNVVDADSYVTATWMFLDDAGAPTIFYSRGPEGVDDWRFRSASLDAGVWRIKKLPTDEAGGDLSVAVDSLGRYHLAWRSGGFYGTGVLRYALLDGGSWHEEVVDPTSGGTSDTAIAVDPDGNPHIAYVPEIVGKPMRYARWNGSVWEFEDVLAQGVGIYSPSLALDSAGEPHVAYAFAGGAEVHHSYRSGGVWTHETVAVVTPNQSLEMSLAIDSADGVHLAYDEVYDVGIHYATRTGSGWTSELVDPGQRWDPSLALDAGGTPHIAFYDAEHGALRYATRNATGWCAQTIDDSRNEFTRIGRNASLAIDAEGRAHVSYHFHRIVSPCQVFHAVSEP